MIARKVLQSHLGIPSRCLGIPLLNFTRAESTDSGFDRGNEREKYYDKGEGNTNDEVYWPWMFSKTLEHDKDTGFAKKNDIKKIVKAQRIYKENKEARRYYEDLESLPSKLPNREERRKLEGVVCGNSKNLIGVDPSIPRSDTFYEITDGKGMFEMAEVYVQSLVRDIAFYDFKSDRKVVKYLKWLNKFGEDNITAPVQFSRSKNKYRINRKTFLRGKGIDELEGPYISQFLYLPFENGNNVYHQKYFPEPDNKESVTKAGWLKIQNTFEVYHESLIGQNDRKFKYCHTPRVLGSMVHRDPWYNFYTNAALIALQNDIEPQGFDEELRSTEWTSSGYPDILISVAHVALGAFRVAWYNKFGVGMKIRPEVYAQRIQLAYEKDLDFRKKVENLQDLKIKCDSYMTELLEEVSEKNNELLREDNDEKRYYLNLLYPEGSPTHPSHPAGHACVAGACCTVLKAMFQCHTNDKKREKLPWPKYAKHSVNGDTLIDFNDDHDMTIVGEFNKLASNVSLGRDFAGVHYRCDGYCGMKIGEEYAISYLIDKCKEYYEIDPLRLFDGFFLEKFDGTKVVITRSGVEEY